MVSIVCGKLVCPVLFEKLTSNSTDSTSLNKAAGGGGRGEEYGRGGGGLVQRIKA